MSGKLEETNEAYAIAKIAGIKLCSILNDQYGKDIICLMPTNLYGPGDNFDVKSSHVIPGMITKFINAKKLKENVKIWGTGKPIREFIHVEDAAEDTVKILSEDYENEHIILTGQQIYKIVDLLSMIKEIIQDKSIKINCNNDYPNVHYTMTPYTFNPKYGKKIFPEKHIDFGQGLLQIIEEIHKSLK